MHSYVDTDMVDVTKKQHTPSEDQLMHFSQTDMRRHATYASLVKGKNNFIFKSTTQELFFTFSYEFLHVNRIILIPTLMPSSPLPIRLDVLRGGKERASLTCYMEMSAMCALPHASSLGSKTSSSFPAAFKSVVWLAMRKYVAHYTLFKHFPEGGRT